MQRVLLTGAAGGIGTRLRQMLPARYPNLRFSDLKAPADLKASEDFVAADLTDGVVLDHSADDSLVPSARATDRA